MYFPYLLFVELDKSYSWWYAVVDKVKMHDQKVGKMNGVLYLEGWYSNFFMKINLHNVFKCNVIKISTSSTDRSLR